MSRETHEVGIGTFKQKDFGKHVHHLRQRSEGNADKAVAAAVPNVIQKHQKVFKKRSDNEERYTRLMPSRVNQKNHHLPYWSLKLMEAHWGH